jgi:quercetin dioxygenase-like cupin family protein
MDHCGAVTMKKDLGKDAAKLPLGYRFSQPAGMLADMAVDGVTTTWLYDDKLWVPQSEGVWFKPLFFGVSQGCYINLLRVRKAGILSCHRHSGAVHAFVLKGRWFYLEHDWVVETGGYAFEPPGETHTLYVPADVSEMITLFHVSGGYTYLNSEGEAVGYEDVFTKLEKAQSHYRSIGLDDDYVRQFVR